MHLQRWLMGYTIDVTAERVGDDWHLRITGGCAPHVGSVTLAWNEDGIVKFKSVVKPTHKDYVVGEKFALKIAEATQGTVSVESGIHYDCLNSTEIANVVAMTDNMLEELLKLDLRTL